MISISAFINTEGLFKKILYRSFQERLCRIKDDSKKKVMHKDMEDFLKKRELKV